MRAWKPVVLAVAISLTAPAVATATTINVVPGAADDAVGNPNACTSPGGVDQCPTLRDAVAFANAFDAGNDPTIQLAAGTYGLVNGPIATTTAMTIAGVGDSGAGASTIQQNGAFGVITTSDALTLNSLIVTGGDVVGADATMANGAPAVGGAGIDATNGASLTLDHVAVTGNRAVGGRGFDQTATTQGGTGGQVDGAAIRASGSLSINSSTISGNTGTGGAGGASGGPNPAGTGGSVLGTIEAAGSASLVGGNIGGNTVTGGGGGDSNGTGAAGAGGSAFAGGILMFGGGSTDVMFIDGNSVTGGAGGVASGTATPGGAGGFAIGGGVLSQASSPNQSVTVSATTISSNSVLGGAGGAAGGTSRLFGTGGAGGAGLGGGIVFEQLVAGSAAVDHAVIEDNVASAGAAGADPVASGTGGAGGRASGGGVLDGIDPATGMPLSIVQSTISGNQAISSSGGSGGTGGSTGADANASGGGLAAIQGATVTLVNSTVFGDAVQSGTGDTSTGTPGSFGGGIDAQGAGTTVGLYNDTIAGNQASAAAGTQFIFGPDLNAFGSGAYTLEDTVIATPNPSNQSACTSVQAGVYTDVGHNLQDSTFSTCGLSGAASHDQLVPDAQLANTLSFNGGVANTLAPSATSPVIGNGGACIDPLANPANSRLTIDERGDPRGATCDIGAFQTQSVTVTGAPAITGTPSVGQTLACASGTFSATGDGPLTATGGITPGGPVLSSTFARSGSTVSTANTYKVTPADQGHTITCTETATGAYGHGQATSAPLSIPAAPFAVKLSAVSQAHPKWAVKKTKHGPPVGTSFTYTLNTPATVTLTITLQTTGRQVRGKCVKQTTSNQHAHRCTLSSPVGTLPGIGTRGTHTIRFNGKLGSHRLAAGTYKVTITAKTSTGRSSATLTFTIAR